MPKLLEFILIIFAFALFCSKPQKQSDDLYSFAVANKNHLSLSTYVTAHSVNRLLSSPAGRREALSLLKANGITKIYIEVYRSGLVVSPELLRQVHDYFLKNGFDVVGGIATVPGNNFGERQEGRLGWFNWQHEKTQQDLKAVMQQAASIFDTFIIDDFLCTADTSQLSRQAKGQRSWSQYRRDLLTQLSNDLFIQPAKTVNPNITIIIKYPQWYDRFHLFGYDVARQPALFDAVWVGTETRGQYTQRYGFVQPYEGFVNYRWLASLSGDKIGGAWFDHGDCDAQDFIEQAYQTVLAGAQEIVLFNYDSFVYGHPGHHLLRNEFHLLVDLAREIAQHPVLGIPAYKPANSDAGGDLYIMDYIGMLGVPLVPVSEYPESASSLFLPTQAAADSAIFPKMKKSLQRGARIVCTSGFLSRLKADQEFIDKLGVEWPVKSQPSEAQQIVVHGQAMQLTRSLDLEAPLKITTAQSLLNAKLGPFLVPFLTQNSDSSIYVLNSHTFSQKDFDAVDEVLLCPRPLGFLDVPQSWTHAIRTAFGEVNGLSMNAPARVTLQPLGKANFVLHNYNTFEVTVVLNLHDPALLMEHFSGQDVPRQNGSIKLAMPSRSRMWVHEK